MDFPDYTSRLIWTLYLHRSPTFKIIISYLTKMCVLQVLSDHDSKISNFSKLRLYIFIDALNSLCQIMSIRMLEKDRISQNLDFFVT